jgi:hypothetical protein
MKVALCTVKICKKKKKIWFLVCASIGISMLIPAFKSPQHCSSVGEYVFCSSLKRWIYAWWWNQMAPSVCTIYKMRCKSKYYQPDGRSIVKLLITMLIYILLQTLGARGSVVGWGTMLQAGRSRFRFLMRSLDFFYLPNPSSRTMALGSTQPLTEMSTRNIPGD